MLNISKIESYAEKLIKSSGITDLNSKIDIDAIASHLGIIVEYKDPKDDTISGAIHRELNRTVIYINSEQPPNRQRFTLAHELGHFILHKDMKAFVDGKKTQILLRSKQGEKSQKEVEANCFAAALLMPAKGVESQYKILKKNENFEGMALVELSLIYSVSIEAMGYRLMNLGIGGI